jgi:hypothetical protein
LWDSSTIILLGDHWFRNPKETGTEAPPSWVAAAADRWDVSDHRTVFMARLPGQKEARSFDSPINTAFLHGLILAMDSGSIQQPKDLQDWLDSHRTDLPTINVYENSTGTVTH